jgi:HK97 family phage major capsid protein
LNSTNTLESSASDRLRVAEERYSSLLSNVESRIAGLPDTASPSDVDAIENEARAQLDAAESEVKEARRRLESAQKLTRARASMPGLIPAGDLWVREPHTYDPRNPEGPSFFADLYAAQRTGSTTATERLQRNNREFQAAHGIQGESRASITTADFYPPVFLSNQYVTTHRARMVFAGLVQQLDLPPYGETVTIPAYTGPTDAANPQAGDNANVQTAAGSTTQLTAPITTYAGYCDVARQWVERGAPGADEVIFGDISRDIARKIEVACLNGSGTNQPLGIFGEGSVPAVTVTGQTAAQVLLKVADLAQRIEVAVGEPADFILMHSRRFAWLASLLDSSGRPLIVPAGQGPYNAFGTVSHQQRDDDLSLAPDLRPSGYFLGIPIYTSPSIQTNNGSGTNEDWMIVGCSYLAARWSDPQGIRSFTFESVASATASIRLQALTYGAFKVRYPTGFGFVKGMTSPSF